MIYNSIFVVAGVTRLKSILGSTPIRGGVSLLTSAPAKFNGGVKSC